MEAFQTGENNSKEDQATPGKSGKFESNFWLVNQKNSEEQTEIQILNH